MTAIFSACADKGHRRTASDHRRPQDSGRPIRILTRRYFFYLMTTAINLPASRAADIDARRLTVSIEYAKPVRNTKIRVSGCIGADVHAVRFYLTISQPAN